jgi:hypothetical protein
MAARRPPPAARRPPPAARRTGQLADPRVTSQRGDSKKWRNGDHTHLGPPLGTVGDDGQKARMPAELKS